MKRGLLIAGGALGGLGAVMAITPPQLGSTNSMSIAGGTAIGVSTSASSATTTATTAAPAPAATTTAAPAATKKATSKAAATTKAVATKKAKTTSKVTVTKSATAVNSNSGSNTAATATDPTVAAPVAAPATVPVAAPAPAKGVTGSFVGPSVFVQYGNVQVQITVVDGHITDAKAVIAPSGKNDRYTNMAVPVLKKQTLAAQSANIQGASGASYTSYGWYKSLQGALAKAGL